MPRPILALFLVLATGCAHGPIRIAAHDTKTPTADGNHVWSYLLLPADAPPNFPPTPRAVVFYVGGSGYDRRSSVLNPAVMGGMADFVALGMPVVLLERRGIGPDGSADPVVARRYADLPTRRADALASMRAYLPKIPPGTPVVLIAASEGGDVAAAMARAEPRITHLVLLATGGGLTQAEELALLVRDPANGYGTPAQLEAALADIRANPDSDREWLGHPYRRWSTALWHRGLDDLLGTSIPVFLAQGDRDTNVPVESARGVRAAFEAAGRAEQVRYCEYAGLDHSFQDGAGRSRFDLVLRDLVAWAGEHGLLQKTEASRLLERMGPDRSR
jgi:alpha-beta hydrolase superfamily lysophospholipase